jgi:hypothetical protein
MKREYGYGVAAIVAIAGFLYYRKQQAIKAAQATNPNQSIDPTIGTLMANSTYSGATGPVETYTLNDRYTAYQTYLTSGTAQALPFEGTTPPATVDAYGRTIGGTGTYGTA